MRGYLHVSAAVLPVVELGYPVHRTMDAPQSRSGLCEKERNISPLPGFEPEWSCP